MEQKWINSAPLRSGIAIVSAICVPQMGSRSNFRAPEFGGRTTSGWLLGAPAAIFPTIRRSNATLQETITIQNTNRKILTINDMKHTFKDGTSHFQGLRPVSRECMQGK